MTRRCAPIALFVYNRAEHVRRTLDALRRNSLACCSDLIVFSDAPKNPQSVDAVRDVRAYLQTIGGFKSLKIVERTSNLGLAASITQGVTDICAAYNRVIVLEDDLETSPYFLTFMNDALDHYAEIPSVAAVSGFHLPSDVELPETFFQRDAECWGWATWRRAWSIYNPDGAALLIELKRRKMLRFFDQDRSYPYVKMLRDQIAGKNDSWAVRWRASVILREMLSIYPGRSLVRNIGVDGSGTHGDLALGWSTDISDIPVKVGDIPVVHHEKAYQAFAQFNRSQLLRFDQKVVRKFRRIFARK